MADHTNSQPYRTQIGIYDRGDKLPCAVNMVVDTDTFPNGGSRAVIRLFDNDMNPMGAVMLGSSEMKRLALQLLLDLF